MARNNSINNTIKYLLAGCLFLLLTVSMGERSYADAITGTPPVYIPLTQIFREHYRRGDGPEQSKGIDPPDKVSYVLTRIDPSNPLPAGSTGDSYRFTVQGSKIENAGPIEFPRPGFYSYHIKAEIPGDFKFVVDNNLEYTIIVDVRNNQTYDLIVSNALGEKVADIQYRYLLYRQYHERNPEPPDTPDTEKGGPGGGGGLLDPNDPNHPDNLTNLNVTDNHNIHDEPVGENSTSITEILKMPDTGDNGNLNFWLIVATVSLAGLLLCVVLDLRERKKNKEIAE